MRVLARGEARHHWEKAANLGCVPEGPSVDFPEIFQALTLLLRHSSDIGTRKRVYGASSPSAARHLCWGMLLTVMSTFTCSASPWLPPGDAGLRHDIEVLADRGVLRGPVMSWPLSWADVARDVLAVDEVGRSLDEATKAALVRVQRAAREAMRSGEVRRHVRLSGSAEPTALRTFSATPREEGELEVGLDWTGDRFAARLQATAVMDAADGQDVRADGSYVGVNVGNFMISAGYMDRWWGPGWDGSLILSNNARPIPALAIERNYSDAFGSRWLSWIGPWRASVMLGQLEGDRTDFPDARFFAVRVTFKPLQQLEIGLSRSAQWCGEGRPCGLDDFGDLLVGRDNDQALAEQPGNQLAGYDARWAFKSFPLAMYGQLIGEDEAGGLPSKLMGLAGVETWGDSRWGQWRAHAEYADTSCNFSRQEPAFNCAYEHSLYTQGYRYRGRSVGHAMDGDGRMTSFGAVLVDGGGRTWDLTVRKVEVNRDALAPQPANTVSSLALDLTNIELSHRRNLGPGQLHLGVGFDDYAERLDGGKNSETRGFAQWTFGF